MDRLKENGFLDVDKILYTTPGLHEVPRELERQLKRQLNNAKKVSKKVIVVYGSRCFVDSKDYSRTIDNLIEEEGVEVLRVNAANCIDMLSSGKEREEISRGKKIYWLSPGWLKHWKQIFKDWDRGLANETFPKNDKAILLNPIGAFDEYSAKYPEEILEFSDWMKIGIEPFKISLDRFKGLLSDCVIRDLEVQIEELKSRLPAHSVPPAMLQQLEDLEERLEGFKPKGG
ncbi:MAG: DUF1638 domain-containing protein [bacterium]